MVDKKNKSYNVQLNYNLTNIGANYYNSSRIFLLTDNASHV